MGRKRWNLTKVNKELAAQIAERFSVDPFAALLLSKRGLTSDAELTDFFSNEFTLINPFSLPDMQQAVDRINDAIFSFEKICIYGDYDADGVTATALLYSYLETQGANATYYIPDRTEDGYGLSKRVVDKLHAMGASLIITVDNGISAVDEAEYIKELDMELIVTDHHLPGDVIPDCVAVVDPHRLDSTCEYKDFAGVGVAFKLACAIEGNDDVIMSDFGDLLCIGTVADIVPLTGENRKLVKMGLGVLNAMEHPGVNAVTSVAGLKNKQIKSSNISFGIGPRINAAGRMGSAELAFDLLLCDDSTTADELANEVDGLNAKRHKTESDILAQADNYFNIHQDAVHYPVLVVCGDDWNEGVLGIVAAKLLEKYTKPAIVLTKKGEFYKGSGRSIEGFSMFDALQNCSEYLTLYGGHAQAAGLTLPISNLDGFTKAINDYAYKFPSAYPQIDVDFKLNPESISLDLLQSLSVLEPFGASNQSPIFGIFGLVIDSVTLLGDKKQHVRIVAHKDGKNTQITLIKFNITPGSFPFVKSDLVDTIVTLDKNEYNGESRVSIVIKDIRPANADDEMMVRSEKLYDRILLKKELSKEDAQYALPDRDLFAGIYTFLRNSQPYCVKAYEYIYYKAVGGNNANLCKVMIALLSMYELGLITINENGIIEVPKPDGKVDLMTASVLKYIESYIK